MTTRVPDSIYDRLPILTGRMSAGGVVVELFLRVWPHDEGTHADRRQRRGHLNSVTVAGHARPGHHLRADERDQHVFFFFFNDRPPPELSPLPQRGPLPI